MITTSRFAIALGLALSVSFACSAQQPTHKDLSYDKDHPSQCLDVYLAKSETPTPAMIYIHGGGWRAGSKNNVPAWLKQLVASGEMSVISVEYRFTDVAVHPAQVNDCLRAIQFVRRHAKQWNIDPARLGATGGSAGGHLTAYVALHDDIADPNSTDEIASRSSRVQCAVSFAGPTDWSLLSTIEHGHPAYRQLLGYEPGTPAEQMDDSVKQSVSPITFASQDDPPVMQVHGDADVIVPIDHAKVLHEALQKVKVESELVVIPGGSHSVAGAGKGNSDQASRFVRQHLLGK